MTILRIALSVVLAGVATLLTAAPAFAHTELVSSDPVNGASLANAPEKVTLTFAEAVTLPANPIKITGPDGSALTVGTPTIDGASVSAPVRTTGPAGQYTLNYTVTADDGDAVKGTVAFTVSAPAANIAPSSAAVAATPEATVAAAPTTAPVTNASGSDTGTPTWVWVAVALGVVAVGGAAVAALRRRAGAGRGTS